MFSTQEEILDVDDEIILSAPAEKDIPAFTEYLNDEEIYRFTLAIPKPYTAQDARAYISYVRSREREYGRPMNWAIRLRQEGKLIGGIGFHCRYGPGSHREEVGYWLAKPYRGKKIMTRVLKRICKHGFEELGLIRIEAPVFDFNVASMKVAEKAGFQKEGIARNAYVKDGKIIDAIVYAICKPK